MRAKAGFNSCLYLINLSTENLFCAKHCAAPDLQGQLNSVLPWRNSCSWGRHWLIQFSSLAQSCPALFDPMDCSTPGFPVHHQLPEPAETHVHRVGDAIQPSHPLSSPSLPAFSWLTRVSIAWMASGNVRHWHNGFISIWKEENQSGD